jgi:hypothetical protein
MIPEKSLKIETVRDLTKKGNWAYLQRLGDPELGFLERIHTEGDTEHDDEVRGLIPALIEGYKNAKERPKSDQRQFNKWLPAAVKKIIEYDLEIEKISNQQKNFIEKEHWDQLAMILTELTGEMADRATAKFHKYIMERR